MATDAHVTRSPVPTLFFLVMQGPDSGPADIPNAQMLLVYRFRGLTSHAADSSLILKPLALLSRLYVEQSPDDDPEVRLPFDNVYLGMQHCNRWWSIGPRGVTLECPCTI